MTKKIIEAKILSNEQIASEIFRIILKVDGEEMDAAPGQFVNLYLHDKSMLLPRPISICFAEPGRITLVYKVVGKGTEALSGYCEGNVIRISTPLGNGYDLDGALSTAENGTIALVAGGLGVPPMVELAKVIRKRFNGFKQNENKESGSTENSKTTKLIAIIGFQDEVFLDNVLKNYCDEVYIATETGTSGFQGNVIELMKAEGIGADYYFSCGPKPMLKALAGYCAQVGRPLQLSLEERMGCGYGACVGCTCKTKETEDGKEKVTQKKVCKDGPVFFGNEVIWDE